MSTSADSSAATSSASTPGPGLVSGPTLLMSTVLGLVENSPPPPSSDSPSSSPGLDRRRACPYVNRPLPPTPFKIDTAATMPSQPATASLSSGSVKRMHPPPALSPLTRSATTAGRFDRRISRDDLFLAPRKTNTIVLDNKRMSRDDLWLSAWRPPAQRPSGSSSSSRPPFHRGLPTPEESPSAASPPLLPASTYMEPPARMATPESFMSGEIPIGMALGSPDHPPPSFIEGPAPLSWQPAITQTQAIAPLAYDRVELTEAPAAAPIVPPAPAAAPAPAIAPAPAPAPAVLLPAPQTAPEPQRSKTTRRKLFGIFGSRRHQEPPTAPAPETVETGPAVMATAAGTGVASSASSTTTTATASTADRPLTRSGTRKHQPIVINMDAADAAPTASTAPAAPTAPAASAANTSRDHRRLPFLRSKASEPAIRPRPDNSSVAARPYGSIPVPTGIAASPYLDVEIPDVRLERYSVMFGGVLGPASSSTSFSSSSSSSSSQPLQPASSLLARRQATLDRLKTINDRLVQEDLERDRRHPPTLLVPEYGGLQRRATTPKPPKSPVVSLWPNDAKVSPSPSPAGPLLSPRLRSNTSPSVGLPAQPKPRGPPQPMPQIKVQTPRFINPLRENPPPRRSATAPLATPRAPVAAMPSMQLSPTMVDSPTEMDTPSDGEALSPVQTQRLQSLRPVIPEPQWQMVSPPAAAVSATMTTTMAAAVDDMSTAVELSIARQISVSRQQREMLRPLQVGSERNSTQSSPAALSSSTAATSPRPPPLKLNRHERLHETRSATPTLVLADTMSSNQQPQSQLQSPQSLSQPAARVVPRPYPSDRLGGMLAAQQLAQNRRSERVVLEAA